MGCRVKGVGCRVQGIGCRVQGLGGTHAIGHRHVLLLRGRLRSLLGPLEHRGRVLDNECRFSVWGGCCITNLDSGVGGAIDNSSK